jgi:TfoX N-terminal domain
VAYDEDLANRIRELIASQPDVSEQAMFGGLAFLVGGNMSVAASGQGGLMVRVDPEEADVLLAKPHAQPFEMRGRAMQGWFAHRRRGRANQTPARTLGKARRRVRTLASFEAVVQRVIGSDAGVSAPSGDKRPSRLLVARRRSM